MTSFLLLSKNWRRIQRRASEIWEAYLEQSGLRDEGITVFFICDADYLLLVPPNTQQEDPLANNKDFFAGKEIFFNIVVDFQNRYSDSLTKKGKRRSSNKNQEAVQTPGWQV